MLSSRAADRNIFFMTVPFYVLSVFGGRGADTRRLLGHRLGGRILRRLFRRLGLGRVTRRQFEPAASAHVDLARAVVGLHADAGGDGVAQRQPHRQIRLHRLVVREHGQLLGLERQGLDGRRAFALDVHVLVQLHAAVVLVDVTALGVDVQRRLVAVEAAHDGLVDVGRIVGRMVGQLVAGDDVAGLAGLGQAHQAEVVDDVVRLVAVAVGLHVLAVLVTTSTSQKLPKASSTKNAMISDRRQRWAVLLRIVLDQELGHDPVVVALRAQDELAHFAHGAAAAGRLGDVVGARMHVAAAVRHADGEANAAQDRQVDDVVADEADLLGRNAQLVQQRVEGRELVMAALVHVGDAKVGRALGHLRRNARADDGRLHARLLQQLDAEAVVDVEGFQRLAVGAVVQAAVGEHAVDVEDHQLDLGGAGHVFELVGVLHQITLARVRSWMCSAPTSLPSSSTTSIWLMRNSSMMATASTASFSGEMARGLACMTSRMTTLLKSCTFSIMRRRSPSVNTPIGLPAASTTAVMPMPFWVISSSASVRRTSAATDGTASPLRMTSRTWVSRRRPSAPPGCERAKSSSLKPRRSSSATASASPSASVTVVDAVGARFSVQASLATETSRCTSASFARLELGLPVIEIRVLPMRLTTGRMAISSALSPE